MPRLQYVWSCTSTLLCVFMVLCDDAE